MQYSATVRFGFRKRCEDNKMLRSNVAKEVKNLIKNLFFCINR